MLLNEGKRKTAIFLGKQRFWSLTKHLICALLSPKYAPISRFVSPDAFRQNASSLSHSTFVYCLDMTTHPAVVSILQQDVLFSPSVFRGVVHYFLTTLLTTLF